MLDSESFSVLIIQSMQMSLLVSRFYTEDYHPVITFDTIQKLLSEIDMVCLHTYKLLTNFITVSVIRFSSLLFPRRRHWIWNGHTLDLQDQGGVP
jgi:hypothetical protein